MYRQWHSEEPMSKGISRNSRSKKLPSRSFAFTKNTSFWIDLIISKARKETENFSWLHLSKAELKPSYTILNKDVKRVKSTSEDQKWPNEYYGWINHEILPEQD